MKIYITLPHLNIKNMYPSHNYFPSIYFLPLLFLTYPATAARPFYMIAHRVLTIQNVEDAIKDGANALEIDCNAWNEDSLRGWWADHDGTQWHRGDKLETLLKFVATKSRQIAFVWLDIKNQDECNAHNLAIQECSVYGLRVIARNTIQKAGIRTLYGMYGEYEKPGYTIIQQELNGLEAINADGEYDGIVRNLIRYGPYQIRQRVYSRGQDALSTHIGDCKDKSSICADLKEANAPKSGRRFVGKVFGWTVRYKEDGEVNKLLGTAGVDGIIYGFQDMSYASTLYTQQIADSIKGWVFQNPEKYWMARKGDYPW